MHMKNTSAALTAVALAGALLLAGCGGDKPETLLASARDYMAKNDHKAAVIQIKNVLQSQPDSAEARYLLGSALLSGGDAGAAEIELRKARDLKHPDDVVVPRLAQTLLIQGQFKKLIEDFSETKLGTASATAELKTALATAYEAEGNLPASRAALDAALAADPQNAAATLVQIRQKLAARDIDGGAAQLEALIARDGSNVEAWRLKGDMNLYAKGALDEALVAFRKALEIRPDYAPGYFGVITVLMRQGKPDEVDKELAAVKKIAPNHPQTRYLETQHAYTKRDYPKARELAQQLLKMTPNNARSLEIAGGIDLQMNALVTAEEQLSKAVQSDPSLVLARRWLVSTYLRMGQPAKALTTLAPVLNDKTTDPAVLQLAGEVQLLNGDAKKAEEYFTRATAQDPNDPRKRTALAMTQMATGKLESGLEQLQDIASSDKGTSADLALISTLLRRTEWKRAMAAIDVLEKKTPNNPVAPHLRGRTQLAMGEAAAARKSFDAALAISPQYMPAVMSIAALDISENKVQDARKRFEAVIAKEPTNARALMALAEIRAREPDAKAAVIDLLNKAVAADPNDAAARVLLVDYLLQQREPKQALTAAQGALAALPEKPEILGAAGRAQMAAGETNQGLTTLARAVSLQPKSAGALIRLADAQVAANNLSAAEQSLRRALTLQPNYLDAQQRLVSLRLRSGDTAEAMKLARQVQQQRPKEAAGFLLEGDAYRTLKDNNKALVAYQAGLKQSSVPDLLVRVHSTLMATGKRPEAERLGASWLQEHPKDVVVPMYLGDVALAQGDVAGAEKHYLKVVGLQPNNAIALNNLAWVTSRLKKEGAIAYAEKANELVPNQPAMMDTLAMLFAEKQDYKKAIELQTKVLSLRSQNPSFKLNLARIYAMSGDKEQARKHLDELAKLGDKFVGQEEVAKLRATL
jgi:putative PEP-CTERM system TPR-repeat lipoprotein